MFLDIHDMLRVCLLNTVTLAWITNTDSFTLKIDQTRFCVSFDILQVTVKFSFPTGFRACGPRIA